MEPKVMVYTDGGSRGNPGPSAIGILIYTQDGKLLNNHREYIGITTNNQAEYAAVLKGLELSAQFTRSEVYCHSDSKLMVSQLSGTFRVKNSGLQEALSKVKEAEKAFAAVAYVHLPRTDSRIRLADNLVNRALDEERRQDSILRPGR
jgi:ribonuclease HI